MKFVDSSSKLNITKAGLLLFIGLQVDTMASTGGRKASLVLIE